MPSLSVAVLQRAFMTSIFPMRIGPERLTWASSWKAYSLAAGPWVPSWLRSTLSKRIPFRIQSGSVAGFNMYPLFLNLCSSPAVT